jgi:hypothetical protein
MVPSPTPKRDHGDPQALRLRSEGKGELVRVEGLLLLFRGNKTYPIAEIIAAFTH